MAIERKMVECMDKKLSRWVSRALVGVSLFSPVGGVVNAEVNPEDLKSKTAITGSIEAGIDRYETMNVGYNGPEVVALKKRMNELGYKMANVAEESYTAQTNAYVRKFEEINGLPVDGIADPKMQALLFSDSVLKRDGSPAVKVELPYDDKMPLTEVEIVEQVNQRFGEFLKGEGIYSDFKLERELFTKNYRVDLGFISNDGSRPFAYIQSVLLFHKNINGEEILALGIKNIKGERKITVMSWPIRDLMKVNPVPTAYINKTDASHSYNDVEEYKTEKDLGLALDGILGSVIEMNINYDPLKFPPLTGNEKFETDYKTMFAYKKNANQQLLAVIWRPENNKLPKQTSKLLKSFSKDGELLNVISYQDFMSVANGDLSRLPFTIAISYQ